MNVSGTSFEASSRELWVRSRTRQCCCCSGGGRERTCYTRSRPALHKVKASHKPNQSCKISRVVVVVTSLIFLYPLPSFPLPAFSTTIAHRCAGARYALNRTGKWTREDWGWRGLMTREGISIQRWHGLDFQSGDLDQWSICLDGDENVSSLRVGTMSVFLISACNPVPGIVLGIQETINTRLLNEWTSTWFCRSLSAWSWARRWASISTCVKLR